MHKLGEKLVDIHMGLVEGLKGQQRLNKSKSKQL